MKSKLYILLIILIAGITALYAESGTCGDNLTWTIENGVLTISGTGNMYNYEYPNRAPWESYKYEAQKWEPRRQTIKKIVILYGVKTIGDEAFSGCHHLTSVTIPTSVTSIGKNAFSYCDSLPVFDNIRYADTYLVEVLDKSFATYSIKKGTKWIGNDAFRECQNITAITIPNSVTSIGDWAFSNCKSLISIEIPNGVTRIGEMAFASCTSLTSVMIGSNVGNIESLIHGTDNLVAINVSPDNPYYCSVDGVLFDKNKTTLIRYPARKQGTHYDIPNGVKRIGEMAFAYCYNLATMTIPNSVISIGDAAFYHCRGWTSVAIPKSVTSIGKWAFVGCWNIDSITIPNHIEYIGFCPFQYCYSLKSINVSSDNPYYCSIDGVLFDKNKTTLICYPARKQGIHYDIPNSVARIGEGAFSNCENLTVVTIPNSVMTIGNEAFYGCSSLTSVTIPNSVTNIGKRAFIGCENIASMTFPTKFPVVEDDIFDDENSILHSNGTCGDNLTWTIENGVLTINGAGEMYNYDVFYDVDEPYRRESNSPWSLLQRNIEKVIINDGCTHIGNGAFACCYGLTSVTIPGSVISIGERAFAGCGLTSVTIPNSVQWIGPGAFMACVLTSVTIPNNVNRIEELTFASCDSLTSVTIPNSVTSIGNHAFAWCREKLTSVKFPNSITRIDEGAFMGCGLRSVVIPEGVTTIKNFAFGYCNYLTSIIIPSSVKTIAVHAFEECSQLDTVVWNATNCTILSDEYSALFSSMVKSLIIGDQVRSIPPRLCEGMKITTVTIPNSVKIVGENAFGWADNLQEIHYPEGLDLSEACIDYMGEKIAYNPKKPLSVYSDVDRNIPTTDFVNDNTFVLIIANQHYKRVEDVSYALNDGSIFNEYCIKTLGISKDKIKYIADATYGEINYGINWLNRISENFDNPHIIVYYAGHGIPDESSKSAYLLPVDGSATDIKIGYKLDDLYAALGKMPASQITVFMDACFSGSKREDGMLVSARSVVLKAKSGVPQGKMVVFSAAQGDETAYPNREQQHGMFTYYLLKKLKETEGNISLKELGDYVTKQVRQQSLLLNDKQQTPCVTPSAEVAQEWQTWTLK